VERAGEHVLERIGERAVERAGGYGMIFWTAVGKCWGWH
jgi:hypothetical protein